MKRTWTCLLAIMIAVFLALPAQAAPAKKDAKETKDPVVKIGVIDLIKFAQESKAAKSALDMLKKDIEDKNTILNDKLKELQAIDAEIKSPDSKFTADERRTKAEKLAQDSRDLKRLQEDMNIDYKKKEIELNQTFRTVVLKIIDDYIKQEGITVVLNRKDVFSMDPAIDITDDIIKRYDAKK